MEDGSRMRFAVELVMLVQGGKEAAGSRKEVKGKEKGGKRKRRRKEKRDREKEKGSSGRKISQMWCSPVRGQI